MASSSPIINPNFFIENWSTILLSLRDLRRDVPINYNQYPGIALTPACFSDKIYTDDKASCVANLIALGYRRFVIDLYLNRNNGGWGICPATSSVVSFALNSSSSQAPSIGSTTSSINPTTSPVNLLARQTQTTSPDLVTLNDPETLGEYKCDAYFNATTLLSIFENWITGTDTDLGARILLFDFNLHETSPPSGNTNPPAPEPLILILQNTGILRDAYTPVELAGDRSNLNGSWFREEGNTNTSEYFTIQRNAEEVSITEDGWPSESYLEFVASKRVVVSYGTIAAGLGYDPSATSDGNNIFPAGYFGQPAIFDGATSPKCYFSNSTFELKETNSSWAQIVDTSSRPFPGSNPGFITGLSSCGYSTTLNSTYSSSPLANVEQYFNHIRDALAWSWEVSEPANTTGREDTFRCASMSANDGRWRVTECGERKLAACRVRSRPYDWTLTHRDSTYSDAAATCDDDDFDAPRTALENAYLLAAVKKARLKPEDRIWIDLNSLSVEACWVTGGENASCPYKARDPGDREVIVSAVAAVIALIVFGLMCFVKVGSWRVERSRRRRRKMTKKRNLEGVEYEGVPS